MQILMLVANPVLRDPRVMKEAASLSSAGYEVSILGLSPSLSRSQVTKGDITIVCIPSFANVSLQAPVWIARFFKRIVPKTPKPRTPEVTSPPDAATSGAGQDATTGTTNTIMVGSARALVLLWHLLVIALEMSLRGLSYRPDIVHANDLNTLIPGYIIARRAKAKLVYDSHELWVELGINPHWYKRFLTRLERWLIRRCDVVITVGDALVQELQKRYGVQRIHAIRNCPELADTPAPGESIKSPEKFRFIYVGAYSRDRGLEEWITAFRYIHGCEFRLMGWGPIEAQLKELAVQQGVSDRVTFLEPVEREQVTYVTACEGDIGVIPFKPNTLNNYLGFPNKLFDYSMSGLAIVSSNMLQTRQYIEANGIGIAYESSDPITIADTVNKLVSQPDRVSNMRIRSWELARAEGNWESEQRKLVNLYQELSSHR